LFVSDGNLLDETTESQAQRQLLSALASLGMASEVLCRFIVSGDREIDPTAWLAERSWRVESAPQTAVSGKAFRVNANGVPVTLLSGASSKPHTPNDAERADFRSLVRDRVEQWQPSVVVTRSGPCLQDALDQARAREIATAALQPDCAPRDGSVFRDADVVITPTRFAAEYLREALGLPCANLPPLVAQDGVTQGSDSVGSVVFDYTLRGGGLAVFVQIAEELRKQLPDIRLVLLGGSGVVTLASGGKVDCVPNEQLGCVWRSAAVYLAPMLGWESMPWTALSALRHGVSVIASDRGAFPELLSDLGTMLPLPHRSTATVPSRLREQELSAWVDAIVRQLEDREFGAAQRRRALEGSAGWNPEKVAPQYAHFLSALADRRRAKTGGSTPMELQNGFARRLSQPRSTHGRRNDPGMPHRASSRVGLGPARMRCLARH
jgi:hypothetical protein